MTMNNLYLSTITHHFADVGKMIESGSGSHFVDANKKVKHRLAPAEKKALKNPDGLEE